MDRVELSKDAYERLKELALTFRRASVDRGGALVAYLHFDEVPKFDNTGWSDEFARLAKNAGFSIASMEIHRDIVHREIIARCQTVDIRVAGQNPDHVRPTWDETWMDVMEAMSRRATCDRGRSAAVLVRDNKLINVGYVGAPAGLPHCDEVGHLFKVTFDEAGKRHEHCVRTVHAETNALLGVDAKGATLYCRMEPCSLICAPMIINAGVVRVVAQRRYHGAQHTRDWFQAANIELVVLHDEEQDYARK